MKNENYSNCRIQKRAAFIILCIILIAALCFLFLFFNGQKKSGHIAVIYQNGEMVDKIDLNTITLPYDLRFENKQGGYNVVHVEQGSISITEASCPDKLCIHVGKIKNSNLPITCLPNKLVVQIEDEGESGIDAVSY